MIEKKFLMKRRKEREDQLKQLKQLNLLSRQILEKVLNPGFLGGIQRFLGFALAGLIVRFKEYNTYYIGNI